MALAFNETSLVCAVTMKNCLPFGRRAWMNNGRRSTATRSAMQNNNVDAHAVLYPSINNYRRWQPIRKFITRELVFNLSITEIDNLIQKAQVRLTIGSMNYYKKIDSKNCRFLPKPFRWFRWPIDKILQLTETERENFLHYYFFKETA